MAAATPSVLVKKGKIDVKKNIPQQQDVLQAVIIADSFNSGFVPLDAEKPVALFPLVNKTLIDFSLEALSSCGIQETFIFCSSHSQQLRNHVNLFWSSEVSKMIVTVISSESFMSVGDAIRELDAKALIRSDFVLINGCIVTTLPLSRILDKHKNCRKTDKGCALTLVYRKALPQHEARSKEDDVLLAVEANTNRIRFYQKSRDRKFLNIPLEVFQENSEVMIHYDLLDSHLSICSPSLPPLYSDNFDYQTFDDLIRGLIVNEEILGNSMYLHLTESDYAAPICNMYMYSAVSQDVIRRWSYPVVPDLYNANGSCFHHLRHNIYKEPSVDLHRACSVGPNVVIGKGTFVGEDTSIENSVIGCNCYIGAGVVIKDSYLWDNVVVGNNCRLDTCLLASDVVLKENVVVAGGCILSYKVVIGDYVSLPPMLKLQSEPPYACDEFGDENSEDYQILNTHPVCDPKYVGVNGHGYVVKNEEPSSVQDVWGKTDWVRTDVDEDDDQSSSCSCISSEASQPEIGDSDEEGPFGDEEDTVMFYSEVLDSLQRGIEEKIKSENLILEINSSKYAYNVTMKEVNSLVMKAILKIPWQGEQKGKTAQQYFTQLKQNLLYFMPLIQNYIKNSVSQLDCLQSIEDFLVSNEELAPSFMKILHLLYEKEVLNENIIIKWYSEPQPGSETVRKQVAPFVKWLQEADEESSED